MESSKLLFVRLIVWTGIVSRVLKRTRKFGRGPEKSAAVLENSNLANCRKDKDSLDRDRHSSVPSADFLNWTGRAISLKSIPIT